MRILISVMVLLLAMPVLAVDTFTIVSDSKKKVEGAVYMGSCKELAAKEKSDNDFSLKGKIKNKVGELSKELNLTTDCKTVGEVTLLGKRGKERREHQISAGQWGVFFKEGWGVDGLVPGICHADVSKPGRYLVLQTRKSEKARSLTGKSLGHGLKCVQMEKLPKD